MLYNIFDLSMGIHHVDSSSLISTVLISIGNYNLNACNNFNNFSIHLTGSTAAAVLLIFVVVVIGVVYTRKFNFKIASKSTNWPT